VLYCGLYNILNYLRETSFSIFLKSQDFCYSYVAVCICC
jgi:hypothetical protein